jgi:hypothetical protein
MSSNRKPGEYPRQDEPPHFSLLGDHDDHVSPQIAAARRAALVRYGGLVEARFANLWPAQGALTGKGVPPPWVRCWPDHPPFVTALGLVKIAQEAIEGGDNLQTIKLGVLLLQFLREEMVEQVREMHRSCAIDHVDVAVARAPQPPPTHRPRLPGEPAVTSTLAPSPPEGWRRHLPGAAAEHLPALTEEMQAITNSSKRRHRGPGDPPGEHITHLTGGARAPWEGSPAAPRHGEPPKRPHKRSAPDDGLS